MKIKNNEIHKNNWWYTDDIEVKIDNKLIERLIPSLNTWPRNDSTSSD